jgi:hypothetical protein
MLQSKTPNPLAEAVAGTVPRFGYADAKKALARGPRASARK